MKLRRKKDDMPKTRAYTTSEDAEVAALRNTAEMSLDLRHPERRARVIARILYRLISEPALILTDDALGAAYARVVKSETEDVGGGSVPTSLTDEEMLATVTRFDYYLSRTLVETEHARWWRVTSALPVHKRSGEAAHDDEWGGKVFPVPSTFPQHWNGFAQRVAQWTEKAATASTSDIADRYLRIADIYVDLALEAMRQGIR